MIDSVRIYLHYTRLSIHTQLEYRVSFVLQTLGQFLVTGTEFLALLVLFHRFNHLGSWSLYEVAFLYGVVNTSFSVADAAATGFDQFHLLIQRGDFDRLLLRPRSTVLQLASQDFTLRRLGRLAQGLIVLVWALIHLDIAWTVARASLLMSAIASGAIVFYALFIIQGTLTFWTIQGLEIVNAASYGGTEAARYPISIYNRGLRYVFTFVVPLACTTYYPGLAILGRPDALGAPPWVSWAAPAAGPLFLVAALFAWMWGVRHYQSTGS